MLQTSASAEQCDESDGVLTRDEVSDEAARACLTTLEVILGDKSVANHCEPFHSDLIHLLFKLVEEADAQHRQQLLQLISVVYSNTLSALGKVPEPLVSLLFTSIVQTKDAEVLYGLSQSLHVFSNHWAQSSNERALEERLDLLRLCVILVDPLGPSSSFLSCECLNTLADTINTTSEGLTHAQLPSICLSGASNVLRLMSELNAGNIIPDQAPGLTKLLLSFICHLEESDFLDGWPGLLRDVIFSISELLSSGIPMQQLAGAQAYASLSIRKRPWLTQIWAALTPACLELLSTGRKLCSETIKLLVNSLTLLLKHTSNDDDKKEMLNWLICSLVDRLVDSQVKRKQPAINTIIVARIRELLTEEPFAPECIKSLPPDLQLSLSNALRQSVNADTSGSSKTITPTLAKRKKKKKRKKAAAKIDFDAF